MQKFRKKRELLEYLGKNPNDNKLVDRMLLRGEVHMENGMYIYESKDEVIEELKKEIKNLKEEQGNNTLSSNSEELYEAKVQWEYWEGVARRYNTLMDLVIKTVYSKIKPLLGSRIEDYEVFREGVIDDVKKAEKSD